MPTPTVRTLRPEDEISHYRIVGPIGAGGMGEVYLAQDQSLERRVALKILPPDLVRSEERCGHRRGFEVAEATETRSALLVCPPRLPPHSAACYRPCPASTAAPGRRHSQAVGRGSANRRRPFFND